mmetsp:Transcript_12230/g.24266  ORF Transcript_12230/g.24266 Transcript_12230/m.24266 type:complete len:245 (-) Transcript_12230:25-759(-)
MAQPASAEAPIHWVTAHVTSYLSTLPGVSHISLNSPPPDHPGVASWERREGISLPSDLKSFYTMVGDGLSLRWQASLGGGVREAGRGGVKRVGELDPVSIDSMENPFDAYYELLKGVKRGVPEADPGWEENSGIRAYALDTIPEYGTACLVYGLGDGPATSGQRRVTRQVGPPEKAQVWFKDRRCKWWFVALDFTSYLRLAIVHLCIKGWWLAYTDVEIDPGCRDLMQRFAPERMLVDDANAIR